jgi:hypothetical protein
MKEMKTSTSFFKRFKKGTKDGKDKTQSKSGTGQSATSQIVSTTEPLAAPKEETQTEASGTSTVVDHAAVDITLPVTDSTTETTTPMPPAQLAPLTPLTIVEEIGSEGKQTEESKGQTRFCANPY